MRNSNIHTVIFLVITVLGLYLSCTTDNRITGGTAGSETTNTYALTVVDDQKAPVPNAAVRIISGEDWLINTVLNKEIEHYYGHTDDKGKVFIPTDTLPDKKLNLLIDVQNMASFLSAYSFSAVTSDATDTIKLEHTASLSGTVQADKLMPDYILLEGTDYAAKVIPETGTYHFSALPSGTYTILASAMSENANLRFSISKTIELHHGEDTYMNPDVDFNNIMVDDFDDKDNLMSVLNTGRWYIVKQGDISVTFPAAREKDTLFIPFQSALVSAGAYAGKSLHLTYSAGSNNHFLIIGAQITKPQAGFMHTDTISFRAKGDGTAKLRLHGEETDNMPQAIGEFSLDTSWQKYTITSDKLVIDDPGNSSATWEDVRHRMSWIAFHPGNTGSEFWLDDIKLNGVFLSGIVSP